RAVVRGERGVQAPDQLVVRVRLAGHRRIVEHRPWSVQPRGRGAGKCLDPGRTIRRAGLAAARWGGGSMTNFRLRRPASAVASAPCALVLAATPVRSAPGRLQPGDLDPAFGDQGVVIETLGAQSAASAIALLPDGKLMVAGYRGGDILLMRFTADGHLDTSF